ncbi:hypothetical protein LTR97_004964 [Elasticomyces elasticus]|uniref:Uncharacterized protein n=1 Tax=Elasticomyces elasticus TaxID=574655 RepID=A0AAN7WCG8_9PEZI|nr:hypothetical protein LTR97_004964 [Elasticomyces elasticus]KAK5729299.1 hypothetical protein LTR15_002441 [Elasticomyces elasticus]
MLASDYTSNEDGNESDETSFLNGPSNALTSSYSLPSSANDDFSDAITSSTLVGDDDKPSNPEGRNALAKVYSGPGYVVIKIACITDIDTTGKSNLDKTTRLGEKTVQDKDGIGARTLRRGRSSGSGRSNMLASVTAQSGGGN